MPDHTEPTATSAAFADGFAVDPGVRSGSAAVIGFNALLYVAGRYLPEYLRVLGAHSALIGLFGSLGLLIAAVYPHISARLEDASLPNDGSLIAVLASLGVLLWLAAPQLGRLWPIPAWAWVFAGLVCVGVWRSVGPGSVVGLTAIDRLSERLPADAARFVIFIAGLLVVTGLLAVTGEFTVGFQIALALAAALGVTAIVLDARSDAVDDDGSERTFVAAPELVADLRSVPRQYRPLLVCDALVRFALGMISVFVVITITSVLQLDATAFGYRFAPGAVFGVLATLELAVAGATIVPGARLAAAGRRSGIAFLSYLVAAGFPFVLVSAPTEPLVVGALFAVFGLRFAGRPARRELIADALAEAEHGAVESYRLVRNVLTVPSALIGGLAYAVDPTVAFWLASVVAIVGVREFLSFAARSRLDER